MQDSWVGALRLACFAGLLGLLEVNDPAKGLGLGFRVSWGTLI